MYFFYHTNPRLIFFNDNLNLKENTQFKLGVYSLSHRLFHNDISDRKRASKLGVYSAIGHTTTLLENTQAILGVYSSDYCLLI